eukprot:2270160-Rhodomonas_salina.1
MYHPTQSLSPLFVAASLTCQRRKVEVNGNGWRARRCVCRRGCPANWHPQDLTRRVSGWAVMAEAGRRRTWQ